MKKDFIINFLLLIVFASLAILLIEHKLWLCFAGAVVALLFVVYRQFLLFERYDKVLSSEKQMRYNSMEKCAETETELHFHKLLMDNVETAVIIATDSGYIEWKNRAAHDIFADIELLPAHVLKAVAEGRNELHINGKEFSLSSSQVLIRNSGKNIIVLKDIHSAIEKSKVEAWHRLVRVLTHEIMNSMTPIISLSATLCENVKTAGFSGDEDGVSGVREGLMIINRRSNGLLSFVENYRKLTRIAAPMKSVFPLSELFADLRRLFTQSFVYFDVDAVADVSVSADRAQLEQVMINLMKNAVEACQDKEEMLVGEEYVKEVFCSASIVQDEKHRRVLVIRLKDNGIGIMTSAAEQVFVPFFTTKKHGSGIGLTLSKQIILNHGGDIELFSREDCGCEVVCRLPLLLPQ